MVNVFKMFWCSIKGLFYRYKFDYKDDFVAWYWAQIPDKRYSNESLREAWNTFKSTCALGQLRFTCRMKYYKTHGHKIFGHSATFDKNGYFFQDKKTGVWWFAPADESFNYGIPCWRTEKENGIVLA